MHACIITCMQACDRYVFVLTSSIRALRRVISSCICVLSVLPASSCKTKHAVLTLKHLSRVDLKLQQNARTHRFVQPSNFIVFLVVLCCEMIELVLCMTEEFGSTQTPQLHMRGYTRCPGQVLMHSDFCRLMRDCSVVHHNPRAVPQ